MSSTQNPSAYIYTTNRNSPKIPNPSLLLPQTTTTTNPRKKQSRSNLNRSGIDCYRCEFHESDPEKEPIDVDDAPYKKKERERILTRRKEPKRKLGQGEEL